MSRTIGPWQTLRAGAMITLVICAPVTLYVPFPFNLAAVAIFLYVGIGGLVKVPIGFRGVPTVLGGRWVRPEPYTRVRWNPDGTPKRRADGSADVVTITIARARFELREGWHWLPPRPFMDAEWIDCREQAVEVRSFTVVSKGPASVRVTVPSAVIRFRIVNPAQSLSVTEDVIDKSLTELVQQVLRAQVRQLDDQGALDAVDDIRNTLQRLADEQATEWGIDVIEALLGELALPSDIQAAYEKLRLEERQRASETLELQHIEARLQELMEPPFSLSREAALELIQTERNKVKKNITEFKGNLSPETRDTLERVAQVFAGRL